MKLFVSLLLFKVTVMDDLKAKNGHFNIYFTWNTVKLADLWLQMACFKDKNGPFILKNGQYFPGFFVKCGDKLFKCLRPTMYSREKVARQSKTDS